jgi:hypothetical protein
MWAMPTYGISGAALGLLCGQLVGLLYSLFMGRDVLLHQLTAHSLLSVILACFVMGGVLWVLPVGGASGLLLRIVAGCLAYALTLLALDFEEARPRLATLLGRGR